MTFAISQLLGNELSLLERLQNWDIGLAKISASFCRNLPDKLSMPAGLVGFKLQCISQNSLKILTTHPFHWLELITVILLFLRIFGLKKKFTHFLLTFQKIREKIKVQRSYFEKIYFKLSKGSFYHCVPQRSHHSGFA